MSGMRDVPCQQFPIKRMMKNSDGPSYAACRAIIAIETYADSRHSCLFRATSSGSVRI